MRDSHPLAAVRRELHELRGSPARVAVLLAGCLLAATIALATRPPAAFVATNLAPATVASGPAASGMRPAQPQGDSPPVVATPTPTAAPAAPSGSGAAAPARVAPRYAVAYRISIPSQAMDMPVLSVGLVNGAMDAPEGPPNSPLWHEAFWLRLTAKPGQPGTTTVAGHLDDTLGRPGGFWNLRQVTPGTDVYISSPDGTQTWHYRISETHIYTLAQATSPAVLGRLYGSAGGGVDDGTARISLITCTGVFTHGEYDHRYIAFGELVPN